MQAEDIGEGFMSLTQLADGTVIFPVYRCKLDGQTTAQGRWGEVCSHDVFRSSDGGCTWGEPAPTYEGCCETHILQRRGGDLLAAFRFQRSVRPDDSPDFLEQWADRRDALVGEPVFKRVFLADSTDGGKTWEQPRPVCDRAGHGVLEFGECHGQLVELPDGRLVLVYDHRYPYENAETIARVSDDGGQTWSAQAYHVSFGMGYPASVALDDGTIVTVTGNTPLYSPQGCAIGDHTWSVQAVRWRPVR